MPETALRLHFPEWSARITGSSALTLLGLASVSVRQLNAGEAPDHGLDNGAEVVSAPCVLLMQAVADIPQLVLCSACRQSGHCLLVSPLEVGQLFFELWQVFFHLVQQIDHAIGIRRKLCLTAKVVRDAKGLDRVDFLSLPRRVPLAGGAARYARGGWTVPAAPRSWL